MPRYFFNFDWITDEQIEALKTKVEAYNKADTEKPRTRASVEQRAVAMQAIIDYCRTEPNTNLSVATEPYSHCCDDGVQAMKQLNSYLSQQPKTFKKTTKKDENKNE